MRLIQLFLSAAVAFSLSLPAEEYEIEEGPQEEAAISASDEERCYKVSYRSGSRCRKRYRRRRNCCCNRDTEASWPGKMQDEFYDGMTR